MGVLWRFLGLLREHFARDGDQRGQVRVKQFLAWHLGFFCRYRPLPEAEFLQSSREHPLIQTRLDPGEDLDPLEGVLRDARPALHERLAEALLSSADFSQAVENATRLDRTAIDDAPVRDDSAALVAG